MKHFRSAVPGLLLGLMLGTIPARAQTSAHTPHVTVTLIPEHLDLAPGSSTRLAIRFEIEPGWHLYFAYPGQSGVGTRLEWQLPRGVTVDSLEWPVPERQVTEGLITQVYQADFTLATTIHASATSGETHLAVKVSWGICRIQCVADDALLRLNLPAGVGRLNPAWKAAASALQRLAAPIPGLTVSATRQASGLALVLHPARAIPPGAHQLTFFPLDGTALDTCIVAAPKVTGGNAVLSLGPGAPTATRLRGILAGWPAGTAPPGGVVDVAIGR